MKWSYVPCMSNNLNMEWLNYAHGLPPDTCNILLAIHEYYNNSVRQSFSVHIVYVEIQYNAYELKIPYGLLYKVYILINNITTTYFLFVSHLRNNEKGMWQTKSWPATHFQMQGSSSTYMLILICATTQISLDNRRPTFKIGELMNWLINSWSVDKIFWQIVAEVEAWYLSSLHGQSC